MGPAVPDGSSLRFWSVAGLAEPGGPTPHEHPALFGVSDPGYSSGDLRVIES
jgi:hypothetical protein